MPCRASASARASSVFPTPVGPTNSSDPSGRPGAANPDRPARTASATASTAASCPTTRRASSSSSASSCARSAAPTASTRPTGIPVARATAAATSSAVSSGSPSPEPARPARGQLGRRPLQLPGQRLGPLVVLRVHRDVPGPRQLLEPLGRPRRRGGRAQLQPRRRPVHQVDRLVRQEPVPHVPVRQHRRGLERRLRDPHPVMALVALPQPAQDLHVWATVGSATRTGSNRRSSAGSFSMWRR